MPKMKTHRGAAKRFRFTGSGKLVVGHSYRSHLLSKKSSRRKRKLRREIVLGGGAAKVVRRLLSR